MTVTTADRPHVSGGRLLAGGLVVGLLAGGDDDVGALLAGTALRGADR